MFVYLFSYFSTHKGDWDTATDIFKEQTIRNIVVSALQSSIVNLSQSWLTADFICEIEKNASQLVGFV